MERTLALIVCVFLLPSASVRAGAPTLSLVDAGGLEFRVKTRGSSPDDFVGDLVEAEFENSIAGVTFTTADFVTTGTTFTMDCTTFTTCFPIGSTCYPIGTTCLPPPYSFICLTISNCVPLTSCFPTQFCTTASTPVGFSTNERVTTATVRPGDAFDRYNQLTVVVGGVLQGRYTENGAATTECSGSSTTDRQVALAPVSVGAVSMRRKIFVPANDEFARTLNYFTNTGGAVLTVRALFAGNLGSDDVTHIEAAANGAAVLDANDDWVVTGQAAPARQYGVDPRLGHVFQNAGAATRLAALSLSDDRLAWSYEFSLAPGQTKIIMHLVTGQPRYSLAIAQAELLANWPATAKACMSAEEIGQVVNFVNTDQDDDGVLGSSDNCPLIANPQQENADGDAFGDVCDNCDLTIQFDQADIDTDGVGDLCDNCNNDANSSQADADQDGAGDECDLCPNDFDKVAPGICGCGTPDVDSDGDGVFNCFDQCPQDPGKSLPQECGCGVPETDLNTNGQTDCIELDQCPDDPSKTLPGVCGCGQPDADANSNGEIDCTESDDDDCPADPEKIEPGICGCGIPDSDLNTNGVIDCVEVGENPPVGNPINIFCAPGSCGAGAGVAAVLSALALIGRRGTSRRALSARRTS